MLEDILQIVIEDPTRFDIIVDDTQTTIYDKNTAGSYEIEGNPKSVLLQLFTALGCSSECI